MRSQEKSYAKKMKVTSQKRKRRTVRPLRLQLVGTPCNSVDQAGQFVPQPREDTKSRRINGADGDAELGGDVGGGPLFDDDFPARFPGGGLKVVLHDLDGAAKKLAPKF